MEAQTTRQQVEANSRNQLPLLAYNIFQVPTNRSSFWRATRDTMNDERVQMQNALYRIQESAQSAAEHGLNQGITEDLRGRRIGNVSWSFIITEPLPVWRLTFGMQVPMPTSLTPTDDQVFITDQRGIRSPNAEFLKQHFLQEGRLTDTQALFILDQATQLLSSEPNLVDVESPVTSKSYWFFHLSKTIGLLTFVMCIVWRFSLRRHPWPICEREYLAPVRLISHYVWAASTIWWSCLKWVVILKTTIRICFSATMLIEGVLASKWVLSCNVEWPLLIFLTVSSISLFAEALVSD